MKSAAEKLDTYLLNTVIAEPKMTVIHNADIASHHSPEQIRIALTQQLYKPVRWVESIKLLNEQGLHALSNAVPAKC